MDFEKILKMLVQPIYLRILIMFVAFVLLLRNVLYLVLGDMEYIFSGMQPQHTLQPVGLEVPALVMTIRQYAVAAYLY